MADADENAQRARREYAHLIALHARLQTQLERVRDELVAPETAALIKKIKARTGSAPELTDVVTAVEEAIRTFQLSESSLQESVDTEAATIEIEGITNLPAHLQRFLADRAESPSFSYEVVEDEVRGWVICWKEYTDGGTIRGYGQFYERPYAWLEE